MVAIAVESDEEWKGLCAVASDRTWASDTALATTAGRLQAAESLRDEVSQWTKDRDAQTLMRELQANGVYAGVVQTAKDLVEKDEQIAARQAFVSVPHPEMGEVIYNNPPYRMSKTPSVIRSAPLIGEHNDEVFREWAKLSDEEFDKLEELGAFV